MYPYSLIKLSFLMMFHLLESCIIMYHLLEMILKNGYTFQDTALLLTPQGGVVVVSSFMSMHIFLPYDDFAQ